VLDPRRLRLLVELSERGTISAVAEALHFTPSTVSHGLATLEQEVGVPLLERGPQSVRLTAAGQSLARDARLLLAGLSAARADARALGDMENDTVTIATFSSAGATLVADALAYLRRTRPPLAVKLISAEPPEALAQLAAGDVDVAVVYDYQHVAEPALDALQVTRLLDDPILACLPAGHSALEDGPVKLSLLRREQFIAGRSGSSCFALTREACRIAGFEPDITFHTDDSTFTCALVAAGAGVALMPALLAATSGHPVIAREIQPTIPPRRIAAVHRPGAARLRAISAALDALAAVVHRWHDAALDPLRLLLP
jgi:DNA-binding transcriptional LysR family regulator